MDNAVLSSTLLLTLLLSVGLFFFIRASSKDRTQEVKLVSTQAEASLREQLQHYFTQRAYQLTRVDPEQNQVTFEGFVQPSLFLAVFLTLLAAIGMLCLALVLSLLFPQSGSVFFGLVLLSPAAGTFYWKTAGRKEQVSLKLEQTQDESTQSQSQITIVAHRDELIALQRALHLTPKES